MPVLQHFTGAEAACGLQQGFQFLQGFIGGRLFLRKAVRVQANQHCPLLYMFFVGCFHSSSVSADKSIQCIIPHKPPKVQQFSQKKQKSRVTIRNAGFQFLLQAKTLVEAINTSTGVNQLLLAGIERVALGADLNTNVLLGRTSGKDIAASAADGGLFVLGMDTFLHFVHLFRIS
jgi:hypothetical protein